MDDKIFEKGHRIGRRSAKLVRPLEKSLNLTIIGPTRTLKIQGFDDKWQVFYVTKVAEVGPAGSAMGQVSSHHIWYEDEKRYPGRAF